MEANQQRAVAFASVQPVNCHPEWRLRHMTLNGRFNNNNQLGTSIYPLVWHVVQEHLQTSPGSDMDHRITLVHIDPSISMTTNCQFVREALEKLSGHHEVWAPVCSNHMYLLHCLGQVLADFRHSPLSTLMMVVVGDHGNEPAFRRLSEKAGMEFCFQSSF